MVIPSQVPVLYWKRCRDLMVDIQTKVWMKRKSRPQNICATKVVVVRITWRLPVRVRVPQPRAITITLRYISLVSALNSTSEK